MEKPPRSLTVKPIKLQGRLEETFYKKSDDGLQYRHKGDGDLWLVETRDGRRATLALPRRGQGWMYDRNTTWLTNPPREGATMATKKRRPPKGYKSWKTYMASIRPNSPKRKRRKAVMANRPKRKAAKARRRSTAVVLVNPAHRKRRHSARRRNPDFGAYVHEAVGMVLNGAIGGAVIVATEASARLIRKRALGMPAGTLIAGGTELGITTTAGILAHHFLPGNLGARAGQLIVDAGFASVMRAMVKQSSAPWVSDALADDGAKPFVVRNGRVIRRGAMGGYVPGAAAARMNGYVPGARAAAPALGGYVAGNGASEMAAAANISMR